MHLFPRANRIAEQLTTGEYSGTQVLAVLLQTLPRFHPVFGKLVIHEGGVVALPRTGLSDTGESYDTPFDNVDRPSTDKDYYYNESIVNPVAAAVVMYRVVSSALEHH